jgi:LmbE family N-acetylglucosaminyl deacetylase
MKILIIAPHPDDETLGAGGTLATHAKKGDELYWCIVTEAYAPEWPDEFIKKRKEEIAQVAKVYGITGIFTLGFPTVKLDLAGQKKINDAMSQVIQEVKPDIVYVPYMYDLNKDHEIAFAAAMVATRPKKGLPIKKILCYETVSETEWGSYSKERAFVPNYYVDITDTFDVKVTAMKSYKSELKEAPHPRSEEVMKALAVKRGSGCGVKMAESFYAIRIRE